MRNALIKVKVTVNVKLGLFRAKYWDRRSDFTLIESITLCHDAQVMALYPLPSPLCPPALAAK